MAIIKISTDLLCQILQRELHLPNKVEGLQQIDGWTFGVLTALEGFQPRENVVIVYKRNKAGQIELAEIQICK